MRKFVTQHIHVRWRSKPLLFDKECGSKWCSTKDTKSTLAVYHKGGFSLWYKLCNKSIPANSLATNRENIKVWSLQITVNWYSPSLCLVCNVKTTGWYSPNINIVLTLDTRGFFLALFGQGHERRSSKKKPLVQSALIYCAKWTLTSSLICQSNRRFHTVITCTSTWMKWQIENKGK